MDERLNSMLKELQQDPAAEAPGTYEPWTSEEQQRLAVLLPRYTVASPTRQMTAALIDRVLPLLDDASEAEKELFDRQVAAVNQKDRVPEERPTAGYWRVFIPQLQLLSVWFWIGSILAIGISILGMEPFAALALPLHTNPVVLTAPLLSLGAVAYACRSYGTPMYELELSFPLSPAQWVMGRVAAILACYIMLFSVASLVLTWDDPAQILPFTASWLVPLCLYSAATVVLLMRWGTMGATVVMLLLWLGQTLLRERLGPFFWLGDLSSPHFVSGKTTGSLLTLLAVIYLVYRLRGSRMDAPRLPTGGGVS